MIIKKEYLERKIKPAYNSWMLLEIKVEKEAFGK